MDFRLLYHPFQSGDRYRKMNNKISLTITTYQSYNEVQSEYNIFLKRTCIIAFFENFTKFREKHEQFFKDMFE